MSRIAPLSGFLECLPADRVLEQQVLDAVRRVCELDGVASNVTRAVEPLDQRMRQDESATER